MPGPRKFAQGDHVQEAEFDQVGVVDCCFWHDGSWSYYVLIHEKLLRRHESSLTLTDPITALGNLARASGDM